MNIKFEQVPPPKVAPNNQIGETLGLCRGLKPKKTDRQFRCACCRKMQPEGSWMVWVPDSVSKGDPVWSVEKAAAVNAYNGNFSAWCFACAPKIAKRPWWMFWKTEDEFLRAAAMQREKEGPC